MYISANATAAAAVYNILSNIIYIYVRVYYIVVGFVAVFDPIFCYTSFFCIHIMYCMYAFVYICCVYAHIYDCARIISLGMVYNTSIVGPKNEIEYCP